MTREQAGAARTYRSPRREQQAAQTRAAVLDAAVLLFAERGWAGTGMRDVAARADVSVETVYAGFGSKSELLKAAIEVGVVGDVEQVPLDQRPEFASLGRGTRAQRCRAAARLMTEIHRRTAGLNRALREAAASDPDAARTVRQGELNRRTNTEQGAHLVLGRPATAQECDGLWAVMDVEVYRLLTELRGWSPEQYEDWLADTIGRLLRRST